jgi:hypothetical protein
MNMEEPKVNMSIEKVVSSSEDGPPSPDFEKIRDGVVLIPRPLDDPRDPLNWPFRKKCIIIATLSIAMFAGYAAPFCGQLNLAQQAKLYHKTEVEITYFVRILLPLSWRLLILIERTRQRQLVWQVADFSTLHSHTNSVEAQSSSGLSSDVLQHRSGHH